MSDTLLVLKIVLLLVQVMIIGYSMLNYLEGKIKGLTCSLFVVIILVCMVLTIVLGIKE